MKASISVLISSCTLELFAEFKKYQHLGILYGPTESEPLGLMPGHSYFLKSSVGDYNVQPGLRTTVGMQKNLILR
jgi:hypothetical protein